MAQEQENDYTFGELLKQFRVREDMSREDLAQHLEGMRSASAIRDWERGKYLPNSTEVVEKLAEALSLNEKDTQLLIRSSQPTAIIHLKTQDDHPKLSQLQDLLPDPRDLQRKYLNRFVGREQELAEIQRKIESLLPKGGFLTVTGPAGQGKSSVLAKLIEQRGGSEQVAYYFIPYVPGPQHQVELLQNLIARLVLKYQFSNINLMEMAYPSLRSTFHQLLKKIAERGKSEVLIIDGLDQLETEHTGRRDLSFLPPDPPYGIVFVLGTRPDDTLNPLKLMNPQTRYALPELSYPDFISLLQRYDLHLKKNLVDSCYYILSGHVFYLDLAVRLFAEKGEITPEEVINQIEDDPDNLLWLSLERLREPVDEWSKVIKPILGVILETCEPLGIGALSQIIGVDEDTVFNGLTRLGGLVMLDERRRSDLFHLKFYDYLRYNPRKPDHVPLFSSKDEQYWHRTLANWCEQQDLKTIWENAKDLSIKESRAYARRYYVLHLVGGQEWQRLFSVLDNSQYGRAKVRKYDPSMRAYASDLDLGRFAAIKAGETVENGLSQLPQLWRYTLLRCSLASRADRYPIGAFGLLIFLGRQQEAIGLAELVTDPTKQIDIFCEMAMCAREQNMPSKKSLMLLRKAIETFIGSKRSLEDFSAVEKLVEYLVILGANKEAEWVCNNTGSWLRDDLLGKLGEALAQAGVWQEAERVAALISDKGERPKVKVLGELGKSLVQAGMWEEAERVCTLIPDKWQQAEALSQLGQALARAGKWEEAEQICTIIPDEWQYIAAEALSALMQTLAQAGVREEAERVCTLIPDGWRQAEALNSLGRILVQLGQIEYAQNICQTIERNYTNILNEWQRVDIWSDLGQILVQLGQEERAWHLWEEAEQMCASIEDDRQRAEALSKLGRVLAQAGQEARARRIWREAEQLCILIPKTGQVANQWRRTGAFRTLGQALAEARMWEEAKRVLTLIEGSMDQSDALKELGKALAQAGIWEEAAKICVSIRDEDIRAESLKEVLLTLSQKEMWEEAEKACDFIPDKGERAEALGRLGQIAARDGQMERAKCIWQNVEKMFIPSISQDWRRAEALSKLAQAFTEAEVWKEARRVCAAILIETWRIKVLSKLGWKLVQKGLLKQAEGIWKEAEQACSAILNEWQRSMALEELVQSLVGSGAWGEAERVSATILPEWARARALAQLALALAKVEEWEEAERVCSTMPDGEIQAEVLSKLGQALMQAGQLERAQPICREAERACTSILFEWKRTRILSELVQIWVQAGAWEEAERVSATDLSADNRAKVLSKLGQALMQVGQVERARSIWKEAAQVCASLSWVQRAEALNELARAFLEAGAWKEVERVSLTMLEGESQAEVLNKLVQALARAGKLEEAERIYAIIPKEWKRARVEALSELGLALARSGRAEHAHRIWDEAKSICIAMLGDWSWQRTVALSKLGQTLVQAEAWQEIEQMCMSIQQMHWPVEASLAFGKALAAKKKPELLLRLVQQTWLAVETREDALQSFALASSLFVLRPTVGLACYEGFQWVDRFFE